MASFDCAKLSRPVSAVLRERDLFNGAGFNDREKHGEKMNPLTKMLAGEGPRVARMVAFDQFLKKL